MLDKTNTISDCTITLSHTSYTYDGTEKKPTVTANDGTKTLVNGTDFTVSYSNNKNVGTAEVIVTGIGKYSGTTSLTFEIVAKVESMLGDVNGDGKLNVTDITKVAAHIKGKKMLDDAVLQYADVNHDGKINVSDITKIAAHIKGKKLLF
ncbi:dockerin type I domain-containing protein [Ruminococcus albus]|uniref:dockerin type I domain-containing protein n=1 Tax=Ruminococcus albus TaxID=1264 RepID=UPI001FA720B4|nr:dockerin type I domain-containing protein [Ruminococcus albus]